MPSQNRKRGYFTVWQEICQCFSGQRKLWAPTFLEKIGQHYYLVDCWNNRVLYSNDLKLAPQKWSILSNTLGQPHSLTSDGRWLVVDESQKNQLSVWNLEKLLSKKQHQPPKKQHQPPDQVIPLSGVRPHRVRYDQKRKIFYCLTACDQKLFLLKAGKNGLKIIQVLELDFLHPYYCRSFTFGEKPDEIYFVAGSDDFSDPNKPIYNPKKSAIYKVKINFSVQSAKLKVLSRYSVPVELANMNDIFLWQQKFFISAVDNQLISCDNLNNLKSDFRSHKVFNLSKKLELSGCPYYLNYLHKEKLLIIPEINKKNQINCCREKKTQFSLWQKIC